MTLTETDFAAMGGRVHVLAVDATPAVVAGARVAVGVLERGWSRFRPDSEVSRINAADGRPVTVSAPTATLIALAVHGWTTTDGAYDPTVLDAIVAAGYDRSFELLAGGDDRRAMTVGTAPGCAGVTVDVDAGHVQLPAGVHIDPGGIGKGLAADLVATALVADGARGALVNIGGDLRAAGAAPEGGWRVAVDLPGANAPQLMLRSGGVATSGTHRRRWMRDGQQAHHLIDPRTGAPAASPVVAATVIAGAAWRAEVLTKAALLADTLAGAHRTLRAAGATGLLVDTDGRVHALDGVERFVR